MLYIDINSNHPSDMLRHQFKPSFWHALYRHQFKPSFWHALYRHQFKPSFWHASTSIQTILLTCFDINSNHPSDMLYIDINSSHPSDMLYIDINSNHPSDMLYIDINSNHPSNILKEVLTIISKRISEISSSEELFKTPYCKNALEARGYQDCHFNGKYWMKEREEVEVEK